MTSNRGDFGNQFQGQDTLFNTLKFSKALKNGGFCQREAEALTENLSDLLVYLTRCHFATKSDIKDLDSLYVSKYFIQKKIKNLLSIILCFFKL
jgi:hypothetical protein